MSLYWKRPAETTDTKFYYLMMMMMTVMILRLRINNNFISTPLELLNLSAAPTKTQYNCGIPI